ncbi:hypothetical protein HPB49_019125 [Dermacentor silvarum]|uniref:Uncharacterized protein n=1 Tax=Dermacentor silvarum TaxID=543639 RepID=A0ACB8D7L8_DERSI|nr:hypothetical protein HPB49_019125 [Dermacentor silvarum]
MRGTATAGDRLDARAPSIFGASCFGSGTHLRWPLRPSGLAFINWSTGRGPHKQCPWSLPWYIGRAYLPRYSILGPYLQFGEPAAWPTRMVSWSIGAAVWPHDHSIAVPVVAAMYQSIEQALCVRNPGLVTTCELRGVSDHLDVVKCNRFC